MTAASKLVKRVRRHMSSVTHTPINTLAASVDADDVTLSFTFDTGDTGILAQSVLSLGLEDMVVVSASANAATVVRGFNDVTASAPAGSVVRVNEQFSDERILEALNAELSALPEAGLYQVKTTTVTYNSNTHAYQLPADTFMVLDVFSEPRNNTSQWYRVPWEERRGQPTTVFPSGKAIILNSDFLDQRTIQVVYAARFGSLATLADEVETTCSFPATAIDVLEVGAALRLLPDEEVGRSTLGVMADPAREQAVPPGSFSAGNQLMYAHYKRRLGQEVSGLMRDYPTRKATPIS